MPRCCELGVAGEGATGEGATGEVPPPAFCPALVFFSMSAPPRISANRSTALEKSANISRSSGRSFEKDPAPESSCGFFPAFLPCSTGAAAPILALAAFLASRPLERSSPISANLFASLSPFKPTKKKIPAKRVMLLTSLSPDLAIRNCDVLASSLVSPSIETSVVAAVTAIPNVPIEPRPPPPPSPSLVGAFLGGLTDLPPLNFWTWIPPTDPPLANLATPLLFIEFRLLAPILEAALLFITNSPGVRRAGTVSVPTEPPVANSVPFDLPLFLTKSNASAFLPPLVAN